MTASAEIAGILLAAGLGTRFGGRKLEADLRGTPLGLHAAEVLAQTTGSLFAVISEASANLHGPLVALGYTVIDNDDPAAGLSRSLALGLTKAQTTGAQAALICLADMPWVTPKHLARVIGAYQQSGLAVASASGDRRSPPALFPRSDWPALMTLTGDQGARAYLNAATSVSASDDILFDIDRPEHLRR